MIKLTDILNEDENPCWKGYKQIGMKKKGGKEVPNCVPESVVKEESINEASLTISIANIVDELFPKEFFWVYTPQDKERVKSTISDLVRTLNRFYKQQGIKVRFTDTNFKMKMHSKEIKEELSSSERIELYKLYSKAMKAMPQSPKQKKIKQQINKLRVKAGMKPLSEGTINELGIFNIKNYINGIIPASFFNTTTKDKKEKLNSTIKDLINTLNNFWKQHNIPFRVKK